VESVSICGTSLRDDKNALVEFLSSKPKDIESPTRGLELWRWALDYEKPQIPTIIYFVDDRVSEVSGCHLSIRGKTLDHKSSPERIKELIPELEEEGFSLMRTLKWEVGSSLLTVLIARDGNRFQLFDHDLSRTWTERMEPILNS
jgi:hypothetical protein